MTERAQKRRTLVLPRPSTDAPEQGVWLAALEDSRARTRAALAGIQKAELDWVEPPERNTIGSLLYHIAAIELDWLYSEILAEPFPEDFRSSFPHDVRDDEGNLTVVVGESLQHHEHRLQYVRELLVAALRTMSRAEFQEARRLEAYDVSPEWAVHHLLQHEAEHRGQIAMLRKRFASARGR